MPKPPTEGPTYRRRSLLRRPWRRSGLSSRKQPPRPPLDQGRLWMEAARSRPRGRSSSAATAAMSGSIAETRHYPGPPALHAARGYESARTYASGRLANSLRDNGRRKATPSLHRPRRARVPESSTPKGIRAVIYARCSTSEQDYTRQLTELRAAADRLGWQVVATLGSTVSGGSNESDLSRLQAV